LVEFPPLEQGLSGIDENVGGPSFAARPISFYIYFSKALKLSDYPAFLLWLTEQDPVLASMVATRQEEFEKVFEKVGG
jgi:hypothetical protein